MTISCAVVIFNFIDFDCHEKLVNLRRTASLHDVERLQNVFFLIGASIYKVNNPSLEKFRKEVITLSTFDFSDFESILLIYMSHGGPENVIYCKDGQFDFMEESQKIFRNQTLNCKPKYITVQACKGDFDVNLYAFDDKTDKSDDSEITAVLTSSFEGFVSKLGEDDGSMFIDKFTEVLRESWKKKPFLEIFKDFIKEFNTSGFQFETTPMLEIRPDLNERIINFCLR